jgi:hypothetical protein
MILFGVFIGSLPLALFMLWVFYLAVMNLKRVKNAGELKGIALYAGTVALFIGYGLDCYVNTFLLTLVLLELPKELTVTARLKRHNLAVCGWGKRVAVWFEPLLNPFDPSGKHI